MPLIESELMVSDLTMRDFFAAFALTWSASDDASEDY